MSGTIAAGTPVKVSNLYSAVEGVLMFPVEDSIAYQRGVLLQIGGARVKTEGRVERVPVPAPEETTPEPRPERSERTPYDTGERAEPLVWVNKATRRVMSQSYPRHAVADDWGKVDLEDDSGGTWATIWGAQEDGRWVLHVAFQDDTARVQIEADEPSSEAEIPSSESSEANDPNHTIGGTPS